MVLGVDVESVDGCDCAWKKLDEGRIRQDGKMSRRIRASARFRLRRACYNSIAGVMQCQIKKRDIKNPLILYSQHPRQ